MINIVPGTLEVEWHDEAYGGVSVSLTLDIQGRSHSIKEQALIGISGQGDKRPCNSNPPLGRWATEPCNNVQVSIDGLLPVIVTVYPRKYTNEVIDWLWVDDDGKEVLQYYQLELDTYNVVVKDVQLPRRASSTGTNNLLYRMSIFSQLHVIDYAQPVRLFVEVLVGSGIRPTVAIALACTEVDRSCNPVISAYDEVGNLAIVSSNRSAGEYSGHEEGTLVQLGTYPLDIYPITVDSVTETVMPVMDAYCKGAASILQVLIDKGLQLGD